MRDVLAALAGAHAAHDDAPIDIAEMAASVRRWIEEQTFVPDSDGTGVQLVDDQAARYGEFDEIALVGLIEGEWPERPKRNIFYPVVAAGLARLADGKGSPWRGRGAIPRAAPVAASRA